MIYREGDSSNLDIPSNEYIVRFCLEKDQQINFEKLIRWCRKQSTGLPITFLLGFYVSLVVKRWWEQYSKLPWPDTIAIYLKGLLEGWGELRDQRNFYQTLLELRGLREWGPGWSGEPSSDISYWPIFSVSEETPPACPRDFQTWKPWWKLGSSGLTRLSGLVTRRRGRCSGAGLAQLRVGLWLTTLCQVVDPNQMGHRGSQHGKKGEVHN